VRLPRDARVWGVREFMVRNVRLSLWLLMGAAVLVLLIACANIGNILLARSDVRRKEMAIRAALGADRARLVRQILGESVAVSLAGGVLGVFLAWWGVGTLITAASTSYPLLRDASIDLRVLAFGLAISVLSGIVFGCIPALQMSGRGGLSGLWESLKEGITGTSARPQRRRTRSALIVFEVALSLMLLLACGLLLRSFVRLQQVHPGFEARGVLTASITLPQLKYPTGPARVALYQGFLENLRRAPEVEAAGLVDHLPLSNSNAGTSIYPEGGAPERPEDVGIVWMRNMSEDYFRAMSIPLLAGRQFAESDRPPAPPVAIVNRTFARRHWPGEDPLGKRFTIGPPRQGVPVFTVVGVAGDVRHTNLAQEPDAEFFLYYRQAAPSRFTGVFRTRSKDPMQLTNVVRQALAAADKDLSISRFTAMDKILSDSTAARRLTMMLLAVFAVLALLLAAVGIYGVISYTVSLRRREIGIRMAMGAPAGRVFRMVAGEAMLLAIIGEAAGLAGILAMRRVLDSQLFGTSPTDPVVFVAVPLLLGAIAFVAAFIPARRAMHVNPLIALRHE
jgi:putative ABC transport system permease protein